MITNCAYEQQAMKYDTKTNINIHNILLFTNNYPLISLKYKIKFKLNMTAQEKKSNC